MVKILYFLCYKMPIPLWLLLLLATPIAVYIGYLKYSNVIDDNTILSLQNEIKTLKYQNTEYEASINALNANIDIKNIQMQDTNFKLSQCYNSLTRLQTGYNEIEAIMNSDSDSCECKDTDAQAISNNSNVSTTPKTNKPKTISSTVNKNGLIFLNKQLGEITK